MGCFTLGFIEQLLIWAVVILVLFAIVKLLFPAILAAVGAQPPGGGIVMTILGYVIWAIVAIFVIIFVFDLLSCAIGTPSLHFNSR
jgi:hypothetical protein